MMKRTDSPFTTRSRSAVNSTWSRSAPALAVTVGLDPSGLPEAALAVPSSGPRHAGTDSEGPTTSTSAAASLSLTPVTIIVLNRPSASAARPPTPRRRALPPRRRLPARGLRGRPPARLEHPSRSRGALRTARGRAGSAGPQQLAASEPSLHGAQGPPEDSCRVFLGQPVEVAEHHGRAVFLRQAAQLLVEDRMQLVPRLVAGERCGRLRRGVRLDAPPPRAWIRPGPPRGR